MDNATSLFNSPIGDNRSSHQIGAQTLSGRSSVVSPRLAFISGRSNDIRCRSKDGPISMNIGLGVKGNSFKDMFTWNIPFHSA
jgi:hypothetical protein